jgi:hypothetical protein
VTTTEGIQAAPNASGGGGQRGRGSLVKAEIHRITARRFIRLLLLLAVVGFLAGTAIAFTQYGKASAEDLEAARARLAADYQMCLSDPNIPAGEEANWCTPPSDDDLQWYLDKSPFLLSSDLPAGIVPIGIMSAALAFLVGATYVGAEWSSRSMVALLFWEPRRMRVIGAKAAVAAGAAFVIGLAGQVLWHLGAQFLARTRGDAGGLPADFWGDAFAASGRAVLLVVLVGLLGFGLTNLMRNTGAALGVAFVYFVVIESAVRAFRPRLAEYLIADNAVALVAEGGHTLHLGEETVVNGQFTWVDKNIEMSNVQGGVSLVVVCLVVVAAGTVLFQRRDLH